MEEDIQNIQNCPQFDSIGSISVQTKGYFIEGECPCRSFQDYYI